MCDSLTGLWLCSFVSIPGELGRSADAFVFVGLLDPLQTVREGGREGGREGERERERERERDRHGGGDMPSWLSIR